MLPIEMGATNNKRTLTGSTMSLGNHLEELRLRLILALAGLAVGVIICLLFGTKIITFIQGPYNRLMPEDHLVVLAPADAFIGYMKVSLITGLIISSPWVFYQLWKFVCAGLYLREKHYVFLAVPFCAILFAGGALFFFFVVAPISLTFFLRFGNIINVAANWTFTSYISFVTVLMLVFGIAFQTPIAIFFLNKTGIVSLQALRNSRKFALLGVFIVAAVATPPDVISQITLAVPLYMLFEFGIILSYFANRKKKSQAD